MMLDGLSSETHMEGVSRHRIRFATSSEVPWIKNKYEPVLFTCDGGDFRATLAICIR